MLSSTNSSLRNVLQDTRLRKVLAVLLCISATLSLAVVPAAQDVLDVPAKQSPLALRTPITGIATKGNNALAVGPRGTVLLSQDAGQHWKQVTVPVSADLTTVRFAGGNTAWAIGHDAVVLRSDDGGESWVVVLDGRKLFTRLEQHYSRLTDDGNKDAERILGELDRAAAQSATPGVLSYPFLDIWMGEGGEGFLAGAFGVLLRTGDGGKTWEPWIERTDNNSRMHLYALEQGPEGVLYLAGEQGLVMRYDREMTRFTAIEMPYNGTFFGLKAAGANLIAYGLRGNAFVSADGARTWKPLALGSEASVVSTLADSTGRLIFVTQAGEVLVSKDDGKHVTELSITPGGEVLSAAMVAPEWLALGRPNGVSVVRLPSP